MVPLYLSQRSGHPAYVHDSVLLGAKRRIPVHPFRFLAYEPYRLIRRLIASKMTVFDRKNRVGVTYAVAAALLVPGWQPDLHVRRYVSPLWNRVDRVAAGVGVGERGHR